MMTKQRQLRQAVNLVPDEIYSSVYCYGKSVFYTELPSGSDNWARSRTCEKLLLDSPKFAPISKTSPSKTKGHRQYPPLHKMARSSAEE
eukprot:scaffold21901_cov59-Cyclotella_meneghiniana.AAC.5